MAKNPAARQPKPSRPLDPHSTEAVLARKDAEDRLDSACAAMLKSPAGAAVFEWLTASLVNEILGPDTTPDQLRYREGARSVVAMVKMRAHRSTSR